MANDDVNDFLNAGGAKPFAFDNIGDSVTGVILSSVIRQQTDMQTKMPAFWDDGKPKNMLAVTIQTELQDDDDDDGTRNVYFTGGNYTAASGTGTSRLTALKDALRKAKLKAPEDGDILTMTFTGMGKPSNKGFSAPKLFTVEYTKAPSNVSLDDLG